MNIHRVRHNIASTGSPVELVCKADKAEEVLPHQVFKVHYLGDFYFVVTSVKEEDGMYLCELVETGCHKYRLSQTFKVDPIDFCDLLGLEMEKVAPDLALQIQLAANHN